MKKTTLAILALVAIFSAKAQTPNWSNGVASIIYAKCSGCHHAGDIAPFPLMSYQDAYMYASGIESAVVDNRMPPWPPDPSYRRFAHERLLSNDEKTKLVDWVAAGAPEGDPNAAPPPPVYSSSNWSIPNPDLTVRIPEYTSPAASADVYRCFAIPANNSNNQYIKKIEVIPGNRSIVHHVLVFQDNTGGALDLDAADPLPGYTSFGGTGVNGSSLITGWVPGGGLNSMPNGFAIKLKPNSAIVIQVHYPAGSAGQLDSTRVNIEYADGTPREMFVAPILNHVSALIDGPLNIPPNTVKKYEEVYTIPNISGLSAITTFSVGPHMHLIGRNFKAYALAPGNSDTIPIINIPNWDFHWQGSYSFQYAQKLPVGTVLRAEATFDNTVNNPYNPSNPPQHVYQGEATNDEMMMAYFSYAYYQPGDENILLDSSLLNTSAIETKANALNISMFPNPVNKEAYIGIPNASGTYALTVSNMMGQVVLNRRITGNEWLDVSALTSGIYVVAIANEKGSYTQKLIKN